VIPCKVNFTKGQHIINLKDHPWDIESLMNMTGIFENISIISQIRKIFIFAYTYVLSISSQKFKKPMFIGVGEFLCSSGGNLAYS